MAASVCLRPSWIAAWKSDVTLFSPRFEVRHGDPDGSLTEHSAVWVLVSGLSLHGPAVRERAGTTFEGAEGEAG